MSDNYKRELCGSENKLHAHERFSYAGNIQKLERFVCVCEDCDRVIHYGKAKIDGYEKEAKQQLKNVRGMSDEEIEEHTKNYFELWSKRSKKKWNVDFSIIKISSENPV